MHTYRVGDRVEVLKYGDWYQARVSKVGQSTVTVFFVTKGGKQKLFTVPGYRVDYDLRPSTY